MNLKLFLAHFFLLIVLALSLTACAPSSQTGKETATTMPLFRTASVPTDAARPPETNTLAVQNAPSTTLSNPATGAQEKAHYISETVPDGSAITPGAVFQKTWTLQNNGSTTWTTDYKLVLISNSSSLERFNSPETTPLPKSVKPGETVDISLSLTAPQSNGQYKVTWQLQNPQGQAVPVDGYDLWLLVNVGNAPAVSQSALQSVVMGGVKADFKNISYANNRIDIVVCFQLPATDDWMPYTSTISVSGQVTDFDTVGWADQGSKYNSSPLASSYRCYSLGYPAKSRPGDQITVTIADLRIDPVFQLEKYCAQAQQQLAATYPDLNFTCNPPNGGAYFNLVQAPASMSAEQARRLINDAIEEAIYGPWTFTFTR